MNGESIFAAKKNTLTPDPEDIQPEIVKKKEDEKPEPNHDISQRIIDDIFNGDEEGALHQEKVQRIIYERDHPPHSIH